jgi:hypothetical protein
MSCTEIIDMIAVPRPNHSEAIATVIAGIKDLLAGWGVPFAMQQFVLRPHAYLLPGLAALLLAILFLVLMYRNRPLPAIIVMLLLPLMLIIEFEYMVPVVSSLVTRTGENIIIGFNTVNPAREIIFCAHMDSKTDVFDHIQRAAVYRWMVPSILTGILAAVWLMASGRIRRISARFSRAAVLAMSVVLVLYWGLVAFAFGGYVFLKKQSCGAVDNAGSVICLLSLAKGISDGRIPLGNTAVTFLLTDGEEVGLQGSDAYVKERFRSGMRKQSMPVYMVNLELIGQKGNLVIWDRVGVFLKYYPADRDLVKKVAGAWKLVTGREPDHEASLSDDSQRFAVAGIPALTIGNSGRPGPGLGGFHSDSDCKRRLNVENIRLAAEACKQLVYILNGQSKGGVRLFQKQMIR